MPLAIITRPTEPLLSIAQVRDQLGFGPDASDDRIAALVAAATAVLDGPEGWLGRAVRRWTLEMRWPRFPVGDFGIDLQCPPISAVERITYVDISGTPETVLDPALWRLDEGTVSPAYGHSWPVAPSGPAAVRIRYTCGYPDSEVPAPILQAIVLQVAATNAMLRKNPSLASETVPGVLSRSWATTDIGEIYDKAAMRLLGPYRVFA